MTFRSAYGNTPLATAGDAAMVAVPTGYEVNDLIQNGPTVENVTGSVLGLGGLAFEAVPIVLEGYNTAKNYYNFTKLNPTEKYFYLLGKKVPNQPSKDKRLAHLNNLIEYLDKQGVDVSLFSNSDLQRLQDIRKNSLMTSLPKGNAGILSGLYYPNNGNRVESITSYRDGIESGEIDLRLYKPHLLVEAITKTNPNFKRISQNLYDLSILRAQQLGLNGVRSGDRLISSEQTYSIWDRYPTKKLLSNKGEHSFNYGKNVVKSGEPFMIWNGPVYELNIPIEIIPLKSDQIFSPKMIKFNRTLKRPKWNNKSLDR